MGRKRVKTVNTAISNSPVFRVAGAPSDKLIPETARERDLFETAIYQAMEQQGCKIGQAKGSQRWKIKSVMQDYLETMGLDIADGEPDEDFNKKLRFETRRICAGKLSTKKTFSDCKDACPKMSVVPAGRFIIGSKLTEKSRDTDEGPQHKVKISKTFAVSKNEITRDQFQQFVKDTDYDTGDSCWGEKGSDWKNIAGRSWRNPGFEQTGSHPVVCVNWPDAQAYVKWLSKKTGRSYRLLSEAEWEYAARAGTSTPFWWGDRISTDMANYDGTYAYGGSKGKYRKKTVPASSFKPNSFGLYNVHGNVKEWVQDCYSQDYEGASADQKSFEYENCEFRVVRGGSWFVHPKSLRLAKREEYQNSDRSYDVGFRVARSMPADPVGVGSSKVSRSNQTGTSK